MGKMNRVMGKHIVITGASSGIGADIAFEVAKLGGIPILLARRVEKLEAFVTTIEKMYRIKAYAIGLDVSDKEEVMRVFASIYEQIGNIDVLINNAGFGQFKYADEITYEEVVSMFEVNVLGLIACTNEVLPAMKSKNAGQIINISSIIGKIPTPKASAYAATKSAILGFTNALRMEMMDTNIQITTINPGPVRTEFYDKADLTGDYTKKISKIMINSKIVAQKIVGIIGKKKRELNFPNWVGLGGICYAVMPVLMEKENGRRFLRE